MNKFVGLFIAVIALATLAGAAIGWRFPFLGQNRSANQLENASDATGNQPVSQAPLRSSQPNRTTAQLRSNQPTRTTAQAPQTNQGQGSTATPTEAAQSDANQPIPALW